MKMSKSKRRAIAAQAAAAPKSPTPVEGSVEFTEEQLKLIFVATHEAKLALLGRLIG